jgi:hypothetical protein
LLGCPKGGSEDGEEGTPWAGARRYSMLSEARVTCDLLPGDSRLSIHPSDTPSSSPLLFPSLPPLFPSKLPLERRLRDLLELFHLLPLHPLDDLPSILLSRRSRPVLASPSPPLDLTRRQPPPTTRAILKTSRRGIVRSWVGTMYMEETSSSSRRGLTSRTRRRQSTRKMMREVTTNEERRI